MTLFPKHVKAFEKQRACSAVSINIQIMPALFCTLYLSSERACCCLAKATILGDRGWEKPPTCSQTSQPPLPNL